MPFDVKLAADFHMVWYRSRFERSRLTKQLDPKYKSTKAYYLEHQGSLGQLGKSTNALV